MLTKAKQEHNETWSNPQMYLRRGILGPHYVLQNFKATGRLDSSDLTMLKITGVLKYKVRKIYGKIC